MALLPVFPQALVSDWYRASIPGRRRKREHAHFPSRKPLTRKELESAGITRAALRSGYVQTEHGMHVPVELVRSQNTDSGFRRLRRIDPVTLVRSHAIRSPSHVATGFGAGAVYGMRYFCDEEPLEFLVPNGHRAGCGGCAGGHGGPDDGHLRFRRTRRLEGHRALARKPDPWVPEVACTDPGRALGHMISVLQEPSPDRGERWRVPDLRTVMPNLSPGFIRSVQVSDALHQAIGVQRVATPSQVPGIPADLAAAVLGSTNLGAESPPETVLRLVLADLAASCTAQIPVWDSDGSLLTVVDLEWEEERVFVFYDGEHHLQRTQRDHDSRVLGVLQRDGGRVHRVTAGQLRDVGKVRELRDSIAADLG